MTPEQFLDHFANVMHGGPDAAASAAALREVLGTEPVEPEIDRRAEADAAKIIDLAARKSQAAARTAPKP